jgi:hypothetical protein
VIPRLPKAHPVLLAIAAINGALVLTCLIVIVVWKERPTDVETSGGLWMVASLLLEPVTLLLCVSLALTACAIGYVLWRDARARRLSDACRSCGYDRAGLAADAKCPECGTQ